MQVPFSQLWNPVDISIEVKDTSSTSDPYGAMSETINSYLGESMGKYVNSAMAKIFTDGLAALKIVKIQVTKQKIVTAHPQEDGSQMSDNQVIAPADIMMEVICPTRDVFTQLMSFWQDLNVMFKIHSKYEVIDNCVIADAPYEISSEMVSAVRVALRFTQLLIYSAISNSLLPKDTTEASAVSTVNNGIVTPAEPKALPLASQSLQLQQIMQ